VPADAAPDHNPPASWRAGLVAGQPAVHIFTSGTTGLPKAALISHLRWVMTGDVMQVTMDVCADDVFYCFLPLYHGAAALSAGATAFAAGACLVLRRKFSKREFWGDVRRYGITICQYVGEICRYLLGEPERADDRDHTLRAMVGAGLSNETWEAFVRRFGEVAIYEGWGATEANANTINVDNRVGSCGRVPFWDRTNLRIVRYDVETGHHPRDADGFMIPCGPGEPGEAIGMIEDGRGNLAGRFEGYTSAEATERKILRNVLRAGDSWWSSGDLLRYDEDGYCYFVDRIGDTYRWKSENVSTMEVADSLGDLPGLETITVYGVKVPGTEGRAGMAALVMQPGRQFDAAAFYAMTCERVPRYAAPVFVRIAPAADLTSTFKLRKVDLQREGFDPALVVDPLYVRDEQAGTYVPFTQEAARRALGV
jgi:fatty-acyl-CoA synthase